MSQGPGPAGPPQHPADDGWQQGPQPPFPHSPYSTGPGSGHTPPPSAPQRPSRKPWLILAGALGCVALLVLVVAGGIGFLALSSRGGDPTAGPSSSSATASTSSPAPTPSAAEPTAWELISPADSDYRAPEELRSGLENSPLTTGSLPAPGSCELPALAAEPTQEQVQAFLDAGSACLSASWSDVLTQHNLSWSTPRVVVFAWPDVPAESACEASTFDQTTPRMCNLDNTLYWPMGAGRFVPKAQPADLPSAYLLDLSYQMMNAVSWQTTVAVYSIRYQDAYTEQDPEWRDAYLRFNLQMRCLSVTSVTRLPASAQPTEAMRTILLDEATWQPGAPPRDVPASSTVRWVRIGLDSGGDLSSCNTWTADSADITD